MFTPVISSPSPCHVIITFTSTSSSLHAGVGGVGPGVDGVGSGVGGVGPGVGGVAVIVFFTASS